MPLLPLNPVGSRVLSWWLSLYDEVSDPLSNVWGMFWENKISKCGLYRRLWGLGEILDENLIVTMVTIMTGSSLGGTFWHMK